MPNAEVIRDVLAPNIDVIPRNERFRFFLARIGYGQTSIPPTVHLTRRRPTGGVRQLHATASSRSSVAM